MEQAYFYFNPNAPEGERFNAPAPESIRPSLRERLEAVSDERLLAFVDEVFGESIKDTRAAFADFLDELEGGAQ